MKSFLKYIPFVFFSILCICFVHWYLAEQQVIPDIAIFFYHAFAEFNEAVDNSILEGIKVLCESISTNSRNMIFALLLRPVWLIFGKSFETYIQGILCLFYLPTMFVLIKFINSRILNDCKELPMFKQLTTFLVFTTPLFLYTLVIGYPDVLALGLVVLSLFFFYNTKIDEKPDFKNLSIFAVLFFFAFLFRRWIFLVWGSFLLSVFLFYSGKVMFSKLTEQEKLEKCKNIIKNLCFCGVVFLGLFIFLAHGVLFDMFDPKFRQLFMDYAAPFSQNYNIVVCWANEFFFWIIAIYLLYFTKSARKLFFKKVEEKTEEQKIYYENLEKRNEIFSFFVLNFVIYFLMFNGVNIICNDHLLWINFCGIVCLIIALYSIFLVCPFKKILACAIILFSLANLYVTCTNSRSGKFENEIKRFFIQFTMAPNKVLNHQILKDTEQVIREKYEENPDLRYCLLCFCNNVYNPHLIFQSAYDSKITQRRVFPPLVDTEALVQNWYFFEIIVADTVFVLEPMQSYLPEEEKCQILPMTQKLIQNKEGFGSAFVLKDKKFLGKYNDQDLYVLQYDRIRPTTKADSLDYKARIIELYPWAEEYFPEYYEDFWQRKK